MRLWLPLLILIAGTLLSILLWRSLVNHEHRNIRAETAKEAAAVRTVIGRRMQVRIQSLEQLANRIAFHGGPDIPLWNAEVALLEKHLPGFAAVEWLDPSRRVIIVAPEAGNERTVGTLNGGGNTKQIESFEQARQSRQTVVSEVTQLRDGRIGFTVRVPAFKNHDFLGEVTGIFKATDIFDAIVNSLETQESALRGYSFSIWNGGREVYAHVQNSRQLEDQWSQTLPFHIQRTAWTLKVWPSVELFKRARTPLPEVALFGGLVTTLLLALAVHLALLARWHAHQTDIANMHLRQEIDERHRAEAILRDTTAQLERSNQELQDFASIASHDLQEPLRKIQAFGDRLNATCGNELGEKGKDYLKRMHSAAGRMRRLIEDLLTFSRVTTRALPFEMVDLANTAAEVIEDLETPIEQSGGKVEVEPLPQIQADPLQMRQLIQNLVGNGLKFHKPGQPPVVRISGRIIEDEGSAPMLQLSVSDNGIGFDEKYLDRIFTVFQRLHARTEFAGTGVGLAICKKIAERHGGSITARSTPGQGAEFIVRLPLQRPKEG